MKCQHLLTNLTKRITTKELTNHCLVIILSTHLVNLSSYCTRSHQRLSCILTGNKIIQCNELCFICFYPSVKPAIFDLVLALGIIVYIIGIYFFVIVRHTRVLYCISYSFSLEFFNSSSNSSSAFKEKTERRVDNCETENTNYNY